MVNKGYQEEWYIWDKLFRGTKIVSNQYRIAKTLAEGRGILLPEDNAPGRVYNSVCLLFNGAVIDFQTLKEPQIFGSHARINYDLPTRIVKITGEYREIVRNTAYRLKLPLEDIE